MMKVKFFPKEQHSIEVCNHRHNADVTITEQTDVMVNAARYAVELYGFRHNVRVGAFLGIHITADHDDMRAVNVMGNIRSDVYMNIQLAAGGIKDYGIAMSKIIPWFLSFTGRMPSAVSFAGGSKSIALSSINDFLVGRNSDWDEYQYGSVGDTFLGFPQEEFNRLNYSNIASTTRWFDNGMSWVDIEDVLEDVINSGGWYRNFTHWHWLNRDGVVYKQEEFYQTLKNKVASMGKKAHFCSYGEAAEYLTYRQLITRVSCYDSINGNVRIAIEVDNLYLQDRINTPISIKVNLSNSVLSGKNITSDNCVIENLGNDIYIVEVPFRINDKDNNIMIVDIKEGAPNYRPTLSPLIGVVKKASSVEIDLDRKCYATLFQKEIAANDENVKMLERSMISSSKHVFERLNFSEKKYYIGVADRFENLYLVDIV